MNLSERDRRALLVGLVLIALLAYRIYSTRTVDDSSAAAGTTMTVESAENRLLRVRRMAAAVPAKEALLKQANADLKRRENGLIQAETAAQAQAQLVQVVRKVARAQTPPVEIRGQEMGQIRPFGDAYGEAVVSLSIECGIEQLVNILSDLTAQPDIVATSELRVTSVTAKEKTVPARITVSGLVPKRLVPAKKSAVSF